MKSMLQPMIQLMQEIMHMKFPWNLWMLILGLVNLIGGVYFIDTLEGKLALLSLFGAMLIMTMVYAKKGFVRLLGLGHIVFWVPMLSEYMWVLLTKDPLGIFKYWLLVTVLVNTISLLLDIVDVIRYYLGDDQPIVNRESIN